MNQQIDKMKKDIKGLLTPNRYEHTMGVMYSAASLAMCYGLDLNQAMMAGLLHDCAKCIPNDEKVEQCRQHNIKVSEIELQNPSLLHAKLGAYLAEEKYHITDQGIIDAIRYHTTGRPDMTMMDKIIYIADYIEPGRFEAPNLQYIRKLAFEDLDCCMYEILKDSLQYLQTRKCPLDPMTEKSYLYYKKLLNIAEEETNE